MGSYLTMVYQLAYQYFVVMYWVITAEEYAVTLTSKLVRIWLDVKAPFHDSDNPEVGHHAVVRVFIYVYMFMHTTISASRMNRLRKHDFE